MGNFLGALMRTLGFLTRLPINSHWFLQARSIASDVHFFPVAGLVIGFFSASCFLLVNSIGFNSWVSAIITVFFTIVLTGALHEDGLADVADAFFVAKSKEDRLKIMKDSRIGTYGTLALLFAVSMRIGLIAGIGTTAGIFKTAIALIAIHSISRGGMVCFWTRLPLARKNGTAAAAGQPPLSASNKSLVVTGVVTLIGGIIFFNIFWIIGAFAVFVLFIGWFSIQCKKRIGGYTGDTLGAAEQCLEILLLALTYLIH